MNKKFYFIFLILGLSFSLYTVEKWKGKIFKEGDITVVENKGDGIWGREIKDRIILKQNLSIGVETGDENQILGENLHIEVDSSGNIFILDPQNYRILKFDKIGRFLWKAGRKGQGPGEFEYPFKIKCSKDNLVAVLDGLLKIHLFDPKGVFIKTVKLRKNIVDFWFLPDGRVLVTLIIRGKAGHSAEFLSKDFEFIKKFPDEYFYDLKIPPDFGVGTGLGFNVIRDKIFLTLSDKYEIREYDFEGKCLRKTKRDLPLKPIEIKPKGHRLSIRNLDISGPTFLLKNGMIVNFLKLHKEGSGKEKFLDFFDKDGKFLGSIKTDDELILVDEEDNFYFKVLEPFPKIVRKSLIIR